LPEGPDGYQPPVISQPPEGLYQFRFSIRFVGDWSQTQSFLKSLQGETARMFLVTDVTAQPDGGPGVITAAAQYEVQGYTYALVPADRVSKSSKVEAGK
jgi:hypothetical protein